MAAAASNHYVGGDNAVSSLEELAARLQQRAHRDADVEEIKLFLEESAASFDAFCHLVFDHSDIKENATAFKGKKKQAVVRGQIGQFFQEGKFLIVSFAMLRRLLS
jgi:hypothetical protein